MRRVPHVWTARVHGSSSHAGATATTHTTYSPLPVAKIYDPFFLRNLGISCEVEAYRRLGSLQGTKVSRFYGYFAAAVPAEHGRTVYIILLEEVPGRDLRVIVPSDVTEDVWAKHKGAIINAVLHLYFDILACGVDQQDMQSRNVILRRHMESV